MPIYPEALNEIFGSLDFSHGRMLPPEMLLLKLHIKNGGISLSDFGLVLSSVSNANSSCIQGALVCVCVLSDW